MRRAVKAIAIWLIALVIPIQGMAAIAMPLCAPVSPAGLAQVAAYALDARLVPDPVLHQHAAMEPAMHTDHGAHQAGSKAEGQEDHSGHHLLKCCSAACAMVAAMPGSILTTRALTGSPAPLHPLEQIYSSVTPDGLDRPPKSSLA